MKQLLFLSAFVLLASCGSLNKSNEPITGEQTVACGMCVFDMTGDECELAIEVDGKYYYVEGSNIHDHGNPDAEGGMCTQERKAQVTGQIKHGVFVAESFTLIPLDD
ncbi:MAG: DUF6370 family protein [bacterium]|nr:DUF6370 family protein [bacterium]